MTLSFAPERSSDGILNSIQVVQKLSANVCLYVHAVGRFKPNYVSLRVVAAVLYGASYRFLAFSVD